MSIAKKIFSIQNYVEFTKEHGIQLKLIQVHLLKLKSYKYAIIHTISFNTSRVMLFLCFFFFLGDNCEFIYFIFCHERIKAAGFFQKFVIINH